MNILVIGGGGPTGKFGRDFCDRARLEGHSVYVISHVDYNTNDPKQISADFENPSAVISAFATVTKELTHLDMMLYNSSIGSYPGSTSDYCSTTAVSIARHYLNYNVYVLYPHLLSIQALKKMDATSKIIFLTTGLTLRTWDVNELEYNRHSGYAGGKAFQNHLMSGLANNNDKGVTVLSVSPHFDYNNESAYNNSLHATYDCVMQATAADNGTIKPIHK